MKTFAEIILQRMHTVNGTTLGYFVVFNALFFTAEDALKLLPPGEYYCQLRKGVKCNKAAGLDIVYEVMNVPNRFDMLFFHVGNSHKDVDGCQAGGLISNGLKGTVEMSVAAVVKFYALMDKRIGLNPIRLVVKGKI